MDCTVAPPGIVKGTDLETVHPGASDPDMSQNPFRYSKTYSEVIQLAVMMHVRFPLSLRNVEDLLHERGIDICHETVRHWVDRFGSHFAHKIRKHRSEGMR